MKRVKRRYLALQLDSVGVPGGKEFMDAIWGAVSRLYGEYGASLTSLLLIDYDVEKKRAVIRTNLAAVDTVRTSVASITSIINVQAAVHVVTVSGTLKSLHQKIDR